MKHFLYTDHCAPECMVLPEGCALSEDRRVIITPDDVPEQIRALKRCGVVHEVVRMVECHEMRDDGYYIDNVKVKDNNQLEMEL